MNIAWIALWGLLALMILFVPLSDSSGLPNSKDRLDVEPPIRVGNKPIGVAYNPENGNIYATNFESHTVSVINSTSGKVIDTILVGTNPSAIAYNPVNHGVYIANAGSNDVWLLDSNDSRVLTTIKVGNAPTAIACNPSTGNIYVTNAASDTLSVINGTTNRVLKTIHVGSHPLGVAYNSGNGGIYVANANSHDVSVINSQTNSPVATITVDKTPTSIAYNPFNHGIYVTNTDSDTLSVINGTTNHVVVTIEVGSSPLRVAANPSTNIAYVTNGISNTVSVINGTTNRIESSFMVEESPVGVAVNPESNIAYVTNIDDNTVSIVNEKMNGSSSRTARVTFGINPINAGYIQCNGKNIEDSKYVVYQLNTNLKCKAIPSSNFTFISWSGNVSNRLSSESKQISPAEFFYHIFQPSNLNIRDDIGLVVSNDAKLMATFIPNIPITADVILIIIIITTVVSIVFWLWKKRRGPLSSKMKNIDSTYYKWNQKGEKCAEHLERMELSLMSEIGKDKVLSKRDLDKLLERISEYRKLLEDKKGTQTQ